MILLYKDGAVSPPLHPIDANVWVLNGWAVSAPPAIAELDGTNRVQWDDVKNWEPK